MAELSDASEEEGSEWEEGEQASWRCGRQLFAGTQLTSRSAKYYDGLHCRQASLLCRLCTGACALNYHRAKFDPAQTDLCECGKQETREHVLLACPLYDEARHSLLQHLWLLKIPTAGQLLDKPLYRNPLLDFLDRTGRFPRLSKALEVEKKEKE
ncbi:Proteophosphoglycan ppg4 [Rhodotorula toruloides ATCC 204091]|uniref:BY PROTMAP: gi/342318870/gb/EGU10827.1/ Proteophosphoglycan ppg4 [Rhodotorula glutinis ATCC 204091] n=1 Tax=Rhodotorula toruloides TaxID=5286 RepID=A0A0K3CA03_RHOTO|nr:Proteophosphoglycan ppg4 [Rhodotorula toruloides ATCC 204091]